MGQLDQFAKQILVEETERVTGGAVQCPGPRELSLTEVRVDSMLVVRDRTRLSTLAAPWAQIAEGVDDIVLEMKMPGDHADMRATQRALLRRQVWQVRRVEDPEAPFEGEVPLWVVAPSVFRALFEKRTVERVAPGCYRVGPSPFSFLWIAANELPLADELIPFLIARSGKALDEFCRWVMTRRPPAWLLRVVEFLPMSAIVYDELLRWVATKTEDPIINERKRRAVRVLLDMTPEVRNEVRDEGRLESARAMLRRALAHRHLVLTAHDDARIDACTDEATLERWHDQAMDATSLAEALR